MKKGSKVAVAISICLIALGIFMFFLILPFLYLYIGIIEEGKTGVRNTKWSKLAVKYSILNPQKEFAINSALPSLILTKDFDTTIKYIQKLEKIGRARDMHYYFAAFAYLHQQNYQEALKYAVKSNNKGLIARSYIKMNDITNAQKTIDEMKKETPVSPKINMYTAEVEMAKENWKKADTEIDKMLKQYPKSLEAMKDKAEISKKLGDIKTQKIFEEKIKQIELKHNKRIK